MNNKIKNILLILLLILLIYLFYRYQEVKYCCDTQGKMYWSEEMKNMKLQDELSFYKIELE